MNVNVNLDLDDCGSVRTQGIERKCATISKSYFLLGVIAQQP